MQFIFQKLMWLKLHSCKKLETKGLKVGEAALITLPWISSSQFTSVLNPVILKYWDKSKINWLYSGT